ncbi:MAG: molybdopterin converting factor subunit 1 [Rhodoferax sp.]
MKVHIKYFASIREALGMGGETVETSASTVGDLRDELIGRGGTYAESLARDKSVRIAVNQTLAFEAMTFTDGAEIAFFPPVTGG